MADPRPQQVTTLMAMVTLTFFSYFIGDVAAGLGRWEIVVWIAAWAVIATLTVRLVRGGWAPTLIIAGTFLEVVGTRLVDLVIGQGAETRVLLGVTLGLGVSLAGLVMSVVGLVLFARDWRRAQRG